MTAELLTRVRLAEEGGSARMNVLVDRSDLHAGHVVSLHGVDGWWVVLEVHETVRAARIKSNRTWSNNI